MSWKRNLILIWISQTLSISGFSLALPFSPFFIQELGVTDPDAVKFWCSLSASAVAISLAIMAPIWGTLADKYGRKPMMLRANFSAMIVLAAMGLAPNVQTFVILRFVQGLFTGTISAAMTFVSASTPSHRQGMALGSLSAAVFAGSFLGPLAGGFLAEHIGYRYTFFLSGALLLIPSMLIFFFVQEKFTPAEEEEVEKTGGGTWRDRLSALGPGGPILALLAFMAVARTFDGPFLPLYVQEINGKIEGASQLTGLLNGVAAIGAMLAGVLLGRLADRKSPPSIGKLSAIGAGCFAALIGLFPSFIVLFPARLIMTFFSGGLDPVFQIWISRITPDAKRGTIFGWSVTAKSLGWAVSPLIAGTIAVHFGTRMVFLAGLLLFWACVPMIGWASKKVLALQKEQEALRRLRPELEAETTG